MLLIKLFLLFELWLSHAFASKTFRAGLQRLNNNSNLQRRAYMHETTLDFTAAGYVIEIGIGTPPQVCIVFLCRSHN